MSDQYILSSSLNLFFYWLSVYLISRNTKSKIAWISGLFLASLVIFGLAEDASKHLISLNNYLALWNGAEWSFVLPVALIYHFSCITTANRNNILSKLFLVLIYIQTFLIIYLLKFTDLMIDDTNAFYQPTLGFLSPRGQLWPLLGLNIIIACGGSALNYYRDVRNKKTNRIKYWLGLISSILYLLIGPFVVFSYYRLDLHSQIQPFVPLLLLIAFLPILIGIFKYRLISDVDYIFDWREFLYLSITMAVINFISGTLFVLFIVPHLGETAYLLMPLFLLITITTHGFYDWLATFIRDLLYNAGRGFALITDQDVTDWVRNFHNPEKLETNSLLKFKLVKQSAKNNHLVDAAQTITRDAIEYFKQPDFPRRTKQNLKYQILKMLTLDDADEGQILWELGFEGYPLKIMDGENHTRKPLFKVESMSDYTAISRNAFFALKKEAIHDLGWRLSYLERSTT